MKTFTVLLVEDHEITFKVAKMMLSDIGGIIDGANTGQEAIKLFQENNYDLVLLDIGLPDINGLIVAEEMRKSKEKIGTPIVIVSAYSREFYKEKTKSADINDYLIKPLTVQQCENLVKKHVFLDKVVRTNPTLETHIETDDKQGI